MNNHDTKVWQEVLRWLEFAREDLDVALQLVNSPYPRPRHACWQCQQAAEKAIKAALLYERIQFPFTHDLDVLRNLLPKGWRVRDMYGDLSDLSEWAVDARYPGVSTEPTCADAIEATSRARLVCDSVTDEFKRRGMLN